MMKDFIRDHPNGLKQFTNVYCTSDHHFGHKKILEFEPIRQAIMDERGWTGTHDDFMIDHWNKTVGPDDLVLHLGDLAFKGLDDYLPKLNGTILLVLGNHDRKPGAYTRLPNVYVVDGLWEFCGKLPVRFYELNTTDQLLSGLILEGVLFSSSSW